MLARPEVLNLVPTLSGLLALLPEDTHKRLRGALAVSIVAAGVEVVSVTAMLPFLAVAVQSGAVAWNPTLEAIYMWSGLSLQAFQVLLGGLVLGLVIAANILASGAKWAQARLVWKAQANLTTRAMQDHLAHDYPHFLGINTAGYQRDVLVEGPQACMGVLDSTVTLARSALIAAGVFASLLYFRPLVALSVGLVLGGSYAIIYFSLRGRIHRKGKQASAENERRFRIAHEAFGSLKEIKFYGLESMLVNSIEGPTNRHFKLHADIRLYSQLPFHALQVIAFGGLIAVFLVLLTGFETLNDVIPSLGFFAFAGYRLMPAMQEGFAAYSTMRSLQPIADRLRRQLRANLPLFAAPAPASVPIKSGIEVSNVFFKYPSAKEQTLRGVTLAIKTGETVGIVGPSGSGKTTLLDLIIGLLSPEAGEILIGGRPSTKDNAAGWRQNIGYVPQSVVLHDASIRENIAFGVPVAAIDCSKVKAAAKKAGLSRFIEMELPGQYDTTVGERGVRLSGGQRQRLGIARALYRDPEVLVLDEATSSLDNETEARIAEELGGLAGQKTIIIVAHRLTTVQRADRIFVLDQGYVVGSGTYDQLLDEDPHFRALARVGASPSTLPS